MLADLIRATIEFVISNYSLSFFVLGLIVSLVAIARSDRSIDRPLVVEKLLAWYVFFSIGIDNFYNFVMHVFFGQLAAAFIGWPTVRSSSKSEPRALVTPPSACSQLSEATIFALQPCSDPVSSRSARPPAT